MWDKLKVTYEGNSKVKEAYINMLINDYKLFQMKEGESIEEIFARFSKIISDLKAFGKPYSSGDQVRAYNDIDDDPEDLEEEIAMVSWNMDGLIRRYRNTRRDRIPPRRIRQYNEQDKNDGKCYKCGRYGHVLAKCPDLKRKVSRGFNQNESFGSWSDEDSSEHEEVANLCFMTILENDMNKLSECRTDEDTSNNECKDNNENYFMARGETSEEVLQDEFQELQMQLNGMRKTTSHSSFKSNQATYKSTKKHQSEQSPLVLTQLKDPKVDQDLCVTTVIKVDTNIPFVDFVYLVDGLKYNILSISQLCDSGYKVKFKKTGCAIEDEIGKIILPRKRYGNAYILDGFETLDGHICLTSISDDPWL
ncbi:uncharacterized protein [Nicotiana sylvestris]|uniref:uncharacterized protein n=1 Tax=Nicotiana sylvestris TaxID=4096 RepID=UPI00388C78D8